jgi:hypothetical protein
MQWSRFIIAAVFFVLGAGIAIPALLRSNNTPSRASSSPTTSAPASGTPRTPNGTLSPAHNGAPTPATPTPSRSGPRRAPSATPTRITATPTPTRITATPTPTRITATPTPTRTTPRPTPTPTPTPTRSGTTSPAPAVPLTASIGAVRCPARSVTVKVTNVGRVAVDYSIEQDTTPTVADRIGPGASRTSRLALKEDENTTVAVVWTNRTLESARRKANCNHPAAPAPAPRRSLPHTGPDSASVVAKVATGVAAMITGLIIFWYGGIWPRRREQVLHVKK